MRIKEVIAQRGMSMTKLHHQSEVAYSTIRAVIRDPYTEITLHTLARLAEALDVPSRDLIEDEE